MRQKIYNKFNNTCNKVYVYVYIWAYGVVFSTSVFHCGDQGSNPKQGGQF